MTIIREFFCDYCNPSRVRRTEGSEVKTGYAVELHDDYPLGWWEVPGKGPSGRPGHACPECVLHNDFAKQDIAARRGAATQRLLGGDEEVRRLDGVITGPTWPAITSPFGGEGDRPADGD